MLGDVILCARGNTKTWKPHSHVLHRVFSFILMLLTIIACLFNWTKHCFEHSLLFFTRYFNIRKYFFEGNCVHAVYFMSVIILNKVLEFSSNKIVRNLIRIFFNYRREFSYKISITILKYINVIIIFFDIFTLIKVFKILTTCIFSPS